MTDKKKPSDNDQSSASEQGLDAKTTIPPSKKTKQDSESLKPNSAISDTITNKKSASTVTKKIKSSSAEHAKISKIGMAALLIAIVGLVTSVISYYWLDQQRIITDDLITTNQKNKKANLQRVNELLKEQENKLSQQLKQMVTKAQVNSRKKIIQLEGAVTRLERNKPSDWLIHETEYLIRIAARTIWLERDTRSAISLLKEGSNRLAELNDPKFLSVRKLIHQDIEQLQLMPVLNTENVILSLMGLNSQLTRLPLAIQQVTATKNENTVPELSNDINDWQENLAKTWDNFLNTFVVIHVRDGSAKPLLSPQYQQNLRENLSLKLQQAQWAAREENSTLYLATLAEIQMWITQYFDMSEVSNQLFLSSIKQLGTEMISFDYPSSLLSLSAIRDILTDKPLAIETTEKTPLLPLTDNEQLLGEKIMPTEGKTKPLSIEEQIHQQTSIQEKADEKVNKDENEI